MASRACAKPFDQTVQKCSLKRGIRLRASVAALAQLVDSSGYNGMPHGQKRNKCNLSETRECLLPRARRRRGSRRFCRLSRRVSSALHLKRGCRETENEAGSRFLADFQRAVRSTFVARILCLGSFGPYSVLSFILSFPSLCRVGSWLAASLGASTSVSATYTRRERHR